MCHQVQRTCSSPAVATPEFIEKAKRELAKEPTLSTSTSTNPNFQATPDAVGEKKLAVSSTLGNALECTINSSIFTTSVSRAAGKMIVNCTDSIQSLSALAGVSSHESRRVTAKGFSMQNHGVGIDPKLQMNAPQSAMKTSRVKLAGGERASLVMSVKQNLSQNSNLKSKADTSALHVSIVGG